LKKLIKLLVAIVAILIAMVLLCTRCGFLLGPGSDGGEETGGEPEGGSAIEDTVKEDEKGKDEITEIKVTVVENEYFYENERVDLDDLMDRIDAFEEKPEVRIKDDNASRKAYDKLIDRLKEKSIQYTEESPN
jgi:hypothetical protein